ncbi:single-stranded DNA-binding protein [Butyrivibrio sp. NC2007]|uniref:single-stranded DNA-binding protein n=1 Tax=Butyrivibrio sp. NC2007 TaxID=1280683 RepID=UPI0003B7347E|nr:single-stranded DNA-binding protein [Butyrivibrio sp. NC2007]
MNKVELMGRLTKDPDVKPAQDNSTSVTRYTLAVDRRRSKKTEEEQTADFIGIVAFGPSADFAGKYFKKGMKVAVVGRIQTGSYTNKDGVRVYTTDVVAEDQEFADSKGSGSSEAEETFSMPDDENLPFK